MSIITKRLDNGITVLIEDIKSINTASLGFFVRAGVKNELPGEEGISHFIEHLLFKGTTNRSAKEISEEIDDQGGMINAYTSVEKTAYYIQMTSNTLEIGIDILNDMFLNSTFTEENIEKERNVIIEEIRMYEDIPEEVVHEENLSFAINGVQSQKVAGTIESLKGINRDKIIKYFNDMYKPENIVIAVAGNINVEDTYERLNKGIGQLKDKSTKRFYDGSMNINSGEKIINQETNQVHLCVNTLGASNIDKDRVSMSVISNVLGGNMSSRLFQKIREERGLAYSVYSYTTNFDEGGLFTIYAGTTHDDYKEVISIIENELKEIKEKGITEKELQRAKNQFLSMVTFGLESSKGKMSRMAGSYLVYGEVRDIEIVIEEIESVNLEDIQRVAKKIFDEKYISKTILGNMNLLTKDEK
ncbi:insulinase family protein [Cetobacterium somerae]|uniref:M16 family metallopeptidase n=1 Tax=Cetobacterium sp. NK01 TaxID=2993530 RepID=UPI002116CF7A|nr:pitrilysin family protein [Cetobacterium sp. NK01]MCQ8212425.1 insulinase family protein [Cetobacterium sp. NK01]